MHSSNRNWETLRESIKTLLCSNLINFNTPSNKKGDLGEKK